MQCSKVQIRVVQCVAVYFSIVHCSVAGCSEMQWTVPTSLQKLLSIFVLASEENQPHSAPFSQLLTWSVIRCLGDYCSLLLLLKCHHHSASVFHLSPDLSFVAFSKLAISETPPRVRIKTLRLVSSFNDSVVSAGCCWVTDEERGSAQGMSDTHGNCNCLKVWHTAIVEYTNI